MHAAGDWAHKRSHKTDYRSAVAHDSPPQLKRLISPALAGKTTHASTNTQDQRRRARMRASAGTRGGAGLGNLSAGGRSAALSTHAVKVTKSVDANLVLVRQMLRC